MGLDGYDAIYPNNFHGRFFFHGDGVRLSPLDTSATSWPIVPASDDEYGAFIEMRISRGNRSTRRKTAPVLHFPLR
jgi:hypothetical protein